MSSDVKPNKSNATPNTDEAFLQFRQHLGNALAFLLAENSRISATEVTLERSLKDALFEIDSGRSADDIDYQSITSAEDGRALSYGIMPKKGTRGKLQRVQNLRVILFGGVIPDAEGKPTTMEGAFDIIEGLDAPGTSPK